MFEICITLQYPQCLSTLLRHCVENLRDSLVRADVRPKHFMSDPPTGIFPCSGCPQSNAMIKGECYTLILAKRLALRLELHAKRHM